MLPRIGDHCRGGNCLRHVGAASRTRAIPSRVARQRQRRSSRGPRRRVSGESPRSDLAVRFGTAPVAGLARRPGLATQSPEPELCGPTRKSLNRCPEPHR
eukprot:5328566-Pyramimonas_sp.AAC.3